MSPSGRKPNVRKGIRKLQECLLHPPAPNALDMPGTGGIVRPLSTGLERMRRADGEPVGAFSGLRWLRAISALAG